MIKASRIVRVLAVLTFACLSGFQQPGHAEQRDQRVSQIASLMEKPDLEPLWQAVFATDWTKAVMRQLSISERRTLARAVRRMKKSTIREGHMEQFRVSWRSRQRPDSEFILTLFMNARPEELIKPRIAFSSDVNAIPQLLAEALEANNIPLALSYYDPASRWTEIVPKMDTQQRQNLARCYRESKPVQTAPDQWIYKGPFTDPRGILVQNELTLNQNQEGRWIALD